MGNYINIRPDGADTSAPLNISRRLGLLSNYIDLKDKYILDDGCGSGEYVKELLKYSPNVHGVEYSEKKVKAFKSSCDMPEIVKRGNIEHLDFKDDTFDLVMVNEVLEHVSDEDKALKEASRVLKAGGMLAVFAPNRFYPFETHGVAITKSGAIIPHLVPFIPYIPVGLGSKFFTYRARNYFPWELKRKVVLAGFHIVEQTFIWQTFENLSRNSPKTMLFLSPLLRKISFTLEKIPFIKMFGVSQLIVARKY